MQLRALVSRFEVFTRRWIVLLSVLCLLFVVVIVPFTRPAGISLSGFILFFIFVFGISRSTRVVQSIRGISGRDAFFVLVFSILFLIFSGFYFSQYRFVPTWDSAFYWSETLKFNDSLWRSPRLTMVEMFNSVNSDDYNQLLCWIMSFPVRVFPSWIGTFFIELVLSAIPSSFLLAAFVHEKSCKNTSESFKSVSFSIIYIIILAIPVALRPIFSGYLDAVGFLLLVSITIALFDDSFIERRVGALAIGFGVVLVFLLRRWFVFAVIGLACSVFCYWMSQIVLNKKKEERISKLRNFIISSSCLVSGAIIPLVVFWKFVERSFGGDYSDSYHSWTLFSSYKNKILDLLSNVSVCLFLISLLALLYLVILFFLRSGDLRQFCINTLILVVAGYIGMTVSLIFFWHIQDFSPQHWYIVLPFLILSAVLPIFTAISMLPRQIRTVSICFLVVLSIVNLLGSFSIISLPTAVKSVFTPTIQRPIRFDGFEQQGEFVDYLRERTSGNDLVYFAAASSDLNSSLPEIYYSPGSITPSFQVAAADVDSRDGFNTAFFDAEFVITSSPVAVHMSKDNEQVVVSLNSLVRDEKSYIGRHYSAERSFQFGHTRKVTVYKRESDFTKDDILRLRDFFTKTYPDKKTLFQDRFDQYISLHFASSQQ